jgi:hypothetical protein
MEYFKEEEENNEPLTAPTNNWHGRGHRKAIYCLLRRLLFSFGFANKHLYL